MTERPLVDEAWDWLKLRPALLLALVAVLLYSQSVGFDYALDDLAVITENRFVKQGFAGMGSVLSSSYWEGFSDNAPAYYRPISLLTFCAEVQLTGGHPALPHLVNALLYGACALLAHALLRRLSDRPTAFAAVLIWVLHPTHVEVVANVKGRDELLGALFGMGMLLAGLQRRLVACGLLMFLAMMSKESSLTLLAVLPAALWWRTEVGLREIGLRGLPPLLGALGWWVCRRLALGSWTIEHPDNIHHVTQNALLGSSGLAEHGGTLLAMLARYLGLLVAPLNLSFDYSIGQVPLVGLGHPLALAGALVLLAWLLGLGLQLRRGRLVGFALFALLATFSVASNTVVLVMGSTMGERYLFLPSLFFCLLVGAGLARLHRPPLLGRANLRMLAPLLALSLLAGARSLARLPDWRDNARLIEADMLANPGNPRISGHFAIVRNAGSKPIVPTLTALQAALDLHATDPLRYHWSGVHAHTATGDVLRSAGRLDEAMLHYESAVELEAAHFVAWFNIGWIHYNQGRPAEAAAAYGTGLRFKADHPMRDADPTPWSAWWLNACIAARDAGRLDMALATCRRATEARPDWGQAWAGLGLVEEARGNRVEAEALIAKARALDPTL